MGRGLFLLSARAVATTTKLGKHSDGGGLCLHVRQRRDRIERLWLFRFKRSLNGKMKYTAISLGPAHVVSLAEAREKAAKCRAALQRGDDPKQAVAGDKAAPTFGAVADKLIVSIEGSLSEKTAAQWRMMLGDDYCASIRPKAIDKVTTDDLVAILSPIWLDKQETAGKLRRRMERVFAAAKVQGHREGENPARWRDHLAIILPQQVGMKRGHHKALPWGQMPAFMAWLRGLDSVSALALEWTILTTVRTSEAILTPRKGEVDRETKLWTIPAHRMKGKRTTIRARKPHVVPLCDRCIAIYDELSGFDGDWLFPGNKGAPLSNMAMMECLKGYNADVTVHGFRSTFRDWVLEATSFSENLAEMALAHVVGSDTERAYRRGEAIEKRRKLMVAWESYCSAGRDGKVIPMQKRR